MYSYRWTVHTYAPTYTHIYIHIYTHLEDLYVMDTCRDPKEIQQTLPKTYLQTHMHTPTTLHTYIQATELYQKRRFGSFGSLSTMQDKARKAGNKAVKGKKW